MLTNILIGLILHVPAVRLRATPNTEGSGVNGGILIYYAVCENYVSALATLLRFSYTTVVIHCSSRQQSTTGLPTEHRSSISVSEVPLQHLPPTEFNRKDITISPAILSPQPQVAPLAHIHDGQQPHLNLLASHSHSHLTLGGIAWVACDSMLQS
jgi:hypothetical protein